MNAFVHFSHILLVIYRKYIDIIRKKSYLITSLGNLKGI